MPPIPASCFGKRPWGRAGMSILEVILVLFFIALLAVLIQASLARARQQARSVKCVSHLQQLYLAHVAWMQDHQQTIPLGYQDGGYLSYGSTLYQREFSKYLPSQIRGRLTGGSPPYLCPEDLESRGTGGLPGYSGYSYGANGFMAVRNQNHAARWTNPAATFLFGDAVTTLIYGNDSYPDRIAFRHRELANFVFLDGHVSHLRLGEIPRPTTKTPFWNAEYLP